VMAVFVHGDVASLGAGSTQFAQIEREPNLVYSLKQSPTPWTYESAQPSADHYLPLVWFGDKSRTWEDLGREYLEKIRDKLAPTDDTRRLALEVSANGRTSREKVAALASHVQDAYTYQAIEFGRRAQIPNDASHTMRLKYGDCKDHAVLLYDLLRANNIPAHLALVNTSGKLRSDMPSLDQFDHMVVYVPQLRGTAGAAPPEGVFLDCTSKNSYALLTPPIGLADTELLVLDPTKPRLVRTGKYPEDAARLISRRHVKLVTDGPGGEPIRTEVEEEVILNEFMASGLRSYLRSHPPAERSEAVQNFFSGTSPLRLDDVVIKDLDAIEKPLTLNLKYAVPDAFHTVGAAAGASLVGRIPSPWETFFFQAEYLQRRKSPFELSMPMRLESTIEFKLPKGFDLKDVNALAESKRTPFVAWATRVKRDGDTMKLEFRARRNAGLHQANEYATFYKDMKSALRVFDRPLTMQAVDAGN
jgi:Transglutaminase-like superfamily